MLFTRRDRVAQPGTVTCDDKVLRQLPIPVTSSSFIRTPRLAAGVTAADADIGRSLQPARAGRVDDASEASHKKPAAVGTGDRQLIRSRGVRVQPGRK